MALQSEVGMLLWVSHAQADQNGASAHRHTEIVDFVAAGDAGGARASAERHVQEMFEAVRTLHRQAWTGSTT